MPINPDALADATDALLHSDIMGAIKACKSDRGDLFGEEGLAEEVRLILTQTPKALSDCPDSILNPLRVATALMVLWGTSSLRSLISIEGDYPYRRTPDAVAHLLCSYAGHVLKLSQWRRTRISKVKVLASGLAADCSICRKASQKTFPIADAPELPHANCRCRDWCKCSLLAVKD